jgi:hypothetical protein
MGTCYPPRWAGSDNELLYGSPIYGEVAEPKVNTPVCPSDMSVNHAPRVLWTQNSDWLTNKSFIFFHLCS